LGFNSYDARHGISTVTNERSMAFPRRAQALASE